MSISDLRHFGAARLAPAKLEQPGGSRGWIVRAPASVTDSVEVALHSYSRDLPYLVPAGNWDTRSNGALPAVGDTCLVVFDERGDAWVPMWRTNG